MGDDVTCHSNMQEKRSLQEQAVVHAQRYTGHSVNSYTEPTVFEDTAVECAKNLFCFNLFVCMCVRCTYMCTCFLVWGQMCVHVCIQPLEAQS